MLLEIQALVSTAVYGTPQRSCTGFDAKGSICFWQFWKKSRFSAWIKRRFPEYNRRYKTDDPALDLAVVASILSSNEDIAISEKYCFAGEIGLSGEIRPVPQIEHRITEAEN